MSEQLVTEKYKQTEVGLVPSDWELRFLHDEINSLDAGISVNSCNEAIDLNHDYAILKTSCVSKGLFIPDEAKKIVTSEIQRAKLNPKKDHIIISRMNTPDLVGECGYVVKDYPNLFLPDRLWMMSFKKKSFINARWLNYILNYSIFRQRIRELGTGTSGSMKNISKSKLLEILIPYPSEQEQTAIATALSDADALISSLEKLIAKKRNIKQGVMQKLLQPKEDWEVKKLGDVVHIRKGQLITESTSVPGNIPVIAGGKTPAYFHNKANRFGKTITISGSGASAGYVAFHNYPIFASDCSTVEEHQDYSIEYVYYLMQLLQDKIYKMQTGGAQPHIHPSDLNPIEVSFPKKEKQEQIAIILSDMDAEISALETKLEKYRKVKLGMMQNLLTGKIRLV